MQHDTRQIHTLSHATRCLVNFKQSKLNTSSPHISFQNSLHHSIPPPNKKRIRCKPRTPRGCECDQSPPPIFSNYNVPVGLLSFFLPIITSQWASNYNVPVGPLSLLLLYFYILTHPTTPSTITSTIHLHTALHNPPSTSLKKLRIRK